MNAFITSLFLFSASLLFSQHAHHTFQTEEGKRSDTLNVLHYEIELDLTDSISKELKGVAEITLLSKQNGLTKVNLDLLKLTVDSVWMEGTQTTNWSHNDTLLSVSTKPNPKNIGDTIRIKVAYHGLPFGEQWGGWYNNANYIFNLGVGFQSIPHNLGKVWHPCVDNFVERATYTVGLKTFGSWIGVGSGILTKVDTVQTSPRILNRTWQLNQEIPTYLYGIAAGRYILLKDTFQGPLTTVESDLYVLSSQASGILGKTQRLEDCFKLYETKFGKYRWDRVGYSTTSQGAMEHATNIAIPSSAPETTIMHELSHHWWGDLITCESDRDMWINEGMAVFSEYLFTEDAYSVEKARSDMHGDLFTVLNTAHKQEDGYQPISGIPRVHTYGTHTYRKGALVGHNLRVKLGDQKAFAGFSDFLDSNEFSAVNSYDFRNGMSKATGVDLTEFFDDWVFSPGLPCYVIDSFMATPTAGLYSIELTVRQLKSNSDHFFGKIPLEVKFLDAQFNEHFETIDVGGELSTVKLQIPINAIYATLNPTYNLNYAMTATDQVVKSVGSLNGQGLLINAQVSSVTDSAYIRVQAYWTGPNISLRNAVDLGVRVSSNRYWRIDGVGAARVILSGFYNAKKGENDFGLLKSSEDSIVVLYREKPENPWEIYKNPIMNIGLLTDSLGGFRIENGALGEYTLAEYDPSFNESLFDFIGEKLPETKSYLEVFPNPSNDWISIKIAEGVEVHITILNSYGAEVWLSDVESNTMEIDVSNWPSGVYYILGYEGKDIGSVNSPKPIDYKRLIVE